MAWAIFTIELRDKNLIHLTCKCHSYFWYSLAKQILNQSNARQCHS
uniref:Uncharacterized protein n=1 Tax=Anguilla anguilla TaxID=7936 RepID=A0A0E9U8N0_ANGAN